MNVIARVLKLCNERRTCKVCGCCIIGNLLCLIILYYTVFYEDISGNLLHQIPSALEDELSFVTRFSRKSFKNKTTKYVLVWTKFFNSPSWVRIIDNTFTHCPHRCRAYSFRNYIDESDAILFHFSRLDLKRNDLPRKRHANQTWVLYALEPTSNIERDMSVFNNVFNWTMSYRRDATVFAPYGSPFKRTGYAVPVPFSKRKKFAFAVISSCYDFGKRYRLISELQKYIDVDVYGGCGTLKCNDRSQGCLSDETAQQYKFRLAFENSHCKDYVTEKVWFPLRQGVIPVVNWVKGQGDSRVNESWVINLYDFSTIKALAVYLKTISQDEKLYNKYLEWRENFTIATSHFHSFCNLCSKLHQTNMTHQVYKDLDGWIRNDICPKYKFSTAVQRWIDRWILYPIGL